MKVEYWNEVESKTTTEQEWVNAYERLPDRTGEYIVCDEYGKVKTTMYHTDGGWSQPTGFGYYRRIIYWCKLPLSPMG